MFKRIIRRTTAIFSITVAAIVFAVAFLPLRAIAGLESPCTYISDLISTNPLSSDLASTGDDHHRCIKVALKTTFPSISGAVTASHTELSFVNGVSSAIQTQLNAKLASASYTAADVLSKMLTVDGAGSTLDADLLDTFSSAAFARLSVEPIFTAIGSSTSGTVRLSSTIPILRFNDTNASADNAVWDFQASQGTFNGTARNDAGSLSADWLTVTGNGSGITSINLAATAVQANGSAILSGAHQRVAYFYQNNSAGSCVVSSASASSGVTSCTRDSAGVYTVTVAAGFTLNPVCTVVRVGDGSAAFQATSTTSVSVVTLDNTGVMARADSAFNMVCMGT